LALFVAILAPSIFARAEMAQRQGGDLYNVD